MIRLIGNSIAFTILVIIVVSIYSWVWKMNSIDYFSVISSILFYLVYTLPAIVPHIFFSASIYYLLNKTLLRNNLLQISICIVLLIVFHNYYSLWMNQKGIRIEQYNMLLNLDTESFIYQLKKPSWSIYLILNIVINCYIGLNYLNEKNKF